MARKAKGSRPSAVDPSPPPTTEATNPPDSRPLCYQCMTHPAKDVLRVGQRTFGAFFCSELCAIDFAIKSFGARLTEWYPVHLKWTLTQNGCYLCNREKQEAAAELAQAVAGDQLDAKEVVHDE